MTEYHDHRDDCRFKFATLDACDCAEKNMLDRIEALIAENAKLHDHIEGVAKGIHKIMVGYEAKLATCEKYRDAYDEMGGIGTQAVRALEAKLAKVVAAAGKMLDAFCVHEDSHQSAAYESMCAALAETERESHD